MYYNRVASVGTSFRVSLEIFAECLLKHLLMNRAFPGSLSREVLRDECVVVLDAEDPSGSLEVL